MKKERMLMYLIICTMQFLIMFNFIDFKIGIGLSFILLAGMMLFIEDEDR